MFSRLFTACIYLIYLIAGSIGLQSDPFHDTAHSTYKAYYMRQWKTGTAEMHVVLIQLTLYLAIANTRTAAK